MQKRKDWKPVFFKFGMIGLFTFSLLFIAAHEPNLDLQFLREVPSSVEPSRLARNLESTHRWPQWFHSLESAQIKTSQPESLNGKFENFSEIRKGSRVLLHFDPKKALKAPFDLTAEISEYIPGKKLSLKIIEDSTHRLTRILDQIEWSVEILPGPKGSLIRGTATAHTLHWRSRLFGRLSQRILMNQIYYPDLMKLAELTQPFVIESGPQIPSPGM